MDKRRKYRVNMMAEVTYCAEGMAVTKRVTDISEDGLYIDTPVPSAVGTELGLRFVVDGHAIEAKGRVAHCQTFIGMGVEFTSISEESRAIIAELVETSALAEPVEV